jgi:membrane-associated phospholipid phosphatase
MTRAPVSISAALVAALLIAGPQSFAQSGDAFIAVAAADPFDLAPGDTSPDARGGSASPMSEGYLFNADYGRLLLKDTGHVLTAPAHWERDDWQNFGLVSLGIVGSALLDRQIQIWTQDHQSNTQDNIARIFEPFGAEYSAAVIGAFYIGGLATDDVNARTVAQDSISASLIAAGIITPALKVIAGRNRPSADQGAYDFHPFNGGASFPSGHATQAFAVASVISAHYEPVWIKVSAYSVASLVGYARIYHNQHFLSDVVAGAAIGTVVGHSVVRLNDDRRGSGLAFAPLMDGDTQGLTVVYRFR